MVMRFHREIDADVASDFQRHSKSLKLILSQLYCEEDTLCYYDFQCLERLKKKKLFFPV